MRALALGVDGPARDYVPGTGDVLVASKLLKAGERRGCRFRRAEGTGSLSLCVHVPWPRDAHVRRVLRGCADARGN